MVSFALIAAFVAQGRACDLCALYTATEARYGDRAFGLGVAEQFTRFATLQDGGEEVDNPAHERIESSITQLYGTYRFHPWIGVQLNLPIITKSFRRLTEHGIENGDETGVGDMTALVSLYPYSYVDGAAVVRLSGLVGVKMPSGSTDRLREELDHDHENTADDPWFPRGALGTRHENGGTAQHESDGVESGVHGHDLALGSGSTDVVVGTQGFAGWQRFFVTAGVQYAIRTTGDFDYRYANDLLWFVGPGHFVVLNDDASVGLQALASGEAKGKDTLNGVRLDDTAITAVYMGPALRATWKDRLAAEISLDLPLLQNNSALQIVPDYRIRGGITWRF